MQRDKIQVIRTHYPKPPKVAWSEQVWTELCQAPDCSDDVAALKQEVKRLAGEVAALKEVGVAPAAAAEQKKSPRQKVSPEKLKIAPEELKIAPEVTADDTSKKVSVKKTSKAEKSEESKPRRSSRKAKA